MANETTKHVFYSWQSDTSKKTNLNAIRKAVKDACKTLEASKSELRLVPDEATRDTSGSPNIALKILEKIDQAEIFIADVTTITPKGAQRPCPNPNVSYELGYAVATLGWDRIILLFNDTIGQFPSDLPFDFIQNRISPYSYGPTDGSTTGKKLSNFLKIAIQAVLDKDPKRPAELKGISTEQVKHARDVENMRWLMEGVHIPTLQQHVTEMPHTLTDQALWFYEGFNGVVWSALFHVYDSVLSDAVEKLAVAWRTALSHDNEYSETPSGTRYVFSSPGDMPLHGKRQENWNEIDTARMEMGEALRTIIDRLRSDYLEIDIHKTNAKAWEGFIGYHKDHDDE